MAVGGSFRRWRRGRVRVVRGISIALAITMFSTSGAYAQSVGGQIPAQKEWLPGGVQVTPSVPGRNAVKPGLTVSQQAAKARAAKAYQPAKVSWPTGSATVALPAAKSKSGAKAGSLPVTVASVDGSSAAAGSASVSFASRDAAAKAGVNG